MNTLLDLRPPATREGRMVGISIPADEETLQDVLQEFFPDSRCHDLDRQLEDVKEHSRQ